jgi:hypothetical protein
MTPNPPNAPWPILVTARGRFFSELSGRALELETPLAPFRHDRAVFHFLVAAQDQTRSLDVFRRP